MPWVDKVAAQLSPDAKLKMIAVEMKTTMPIDSKNLRTLLNKIMLISLKILIALN
jgi:hypothetical protein